MKKMLLILIVLFLIVFFSIYIVIINNQSNIRNLKKYNLEYENYLGKTIYGTELATLINKTINLNETNKIEKDEHNHYIENEEDSIKINVKILYTDKTYSMEEFYNKDIAEFIKFFNIEKFKCTNLEYHKKTGKISKMMFEQLENNN